MKYSASHSVPPSTLKQPPKWLTSIGDLPDHYHGHVWSNGVLPNNYLFFLRTHRDQFIPRGVTHTLHHRYELVVNYRGAGNACLGSRIHRFEPGNALLVKPGVFHRYFGVPKTGFSWLFFTFDLHKEAEPDTLPDAPVKLQPVDLERMDAAAHHYLHSSSELDLFEAGLHMGRILQVLGDRATIEHLHPSPEKELEACDLLRKITCFVNTHMDQALRIQDLADQVGMSESHLRRVFREQFGPSLGAYLRYSRLTRGVQLIHRGDLSISEVATLSGFESVQAFSLSFRNAIGMPPTAYRKYLEDGNAPLRIPMETQPQEPEEPLS